MVHERYVFGFLFNPMRFKVIMMGPFVEQSHMNEKYKQVTFIEITDLK